MIQFSSDSAPFPFSLQTGFVLLHTVPVLYEKYEDQVDAFAEKAEAEIKKQYAVFNVKVLSKIPRGPLKDKKLLQTRIGGTPQVHRVVSPDIVIQLCQKTFVYWFCFVILAFFCGSF